MRKVAAWRRWPRPGSGLAAAAALLMGLAGVARAQPTTEQTLRIRMTVRVPEMATVREITKASVGTLPDGRREVTFAVSVAANCRWTLQVRRRAWWDPRAVDAIEVLRYDGTWVALRVGDPPVVIVPEHEPCRLDTHEVRLRVGGADAERVFERVEFVVAPRAAP